MKQAEMTRLMEEEWGIKYGHSTVCRAIKIWKIPHRVSNRIYENSKLYVDSESVERVDMEGRGRSEIVDRFGIGPRAIKKRALGEESDIRIGEVNLQLEENSYGSESLQGLQTLGTAAMLEKEKENISIIARSTGDTNAVPGPNQSDLAPLL
ncbi:hypothetical protein MFRU_001g01000 [Monilinia fructicola]|nr:hypothetical protein MFRU_001g01000 [Monilinia fructicola]